MQDKVMQHANTVVLKKAQMNRPINQTNNFQTPNTVGLSVFQNIRNQKSVGCGFSEGLRGCQVVMCTLMIGDIISSAHDWLIWGQK